MTLHDYASRAKIMLAELGKEAHSAMPISPEKSDTLRMIKETIDLICAWDEDRNSCREKL